MILSPQLIKTVLNVAAVLLEDKYSISKLFQNPRLVISMHKLILSCLQTKQQPHVSAYLKFSLFLYSSFFFLLLSAGDSLALLGGLFESHAT